MRAASVIFFAFLSAFVAAATVFYANHRHDLDPCDFIEPFDEGELFV